jgi:hypothetical protein
MATANMASVGNADLKAKAGCAENISFTVNSAVESAVVHIKKESQGPPCFTLTIGSGLTLVEPEKIVMECPCLVKRDYYAYDMEVVLTSGERFYLIGKIYFFND